MSDSVEFNGLRDRILLGPGPSTIAPRVIRAMGAPILSHLDPDFVPLLDDVRSRLGRVFRAPEGSLTIATSGTGTSGMETTVANLVREGTRVLVVVSGYFGERLAEMCRRYGATVTRVDVEWGRAVDPNDVRAALTGTDKDVDVVAIVHAETSTGVLNPVADVAAIAHEHGALILVDAVTSLGGHPLDVAGWGLDAVYSCTQKCLGAPSGMSPVAWTPAARERAVASRSFYFDLSLLEDYWVRRKYHHTLSASMLYALREALVAVEEEGLEARWARHRRHHEALASGIGALGLELLPPGHRTSVDAQRDSRPSRGRRGCGETRALDGVLDRDRRRARPASGKDLAGRPHGRQLHAGAAAVVPVRVRAGAEPGGVPV